MEQERSVRGAELPVASPHQYRQVGCGDLFGFRRRFDAQYRPILLARPRQGRQGHRAFGALSRASLPRDGSFGWSTSTAAIAMTQKYILLTKLNEKISYFSRNPAAHRSYRRSRRGSPNIARRATSP